MINRENHSAKIRRVLHGVLPRFQVLFKLPGRLRASVAAEDYASVVRDYKKAISMQVAEPPPTQAAGKAAPFTPKMTVKGEAGDGAPGTPSILPWSSMRGGDPVDLKSGGGRDNLSTREVFFVWTKSCCGCTLLDSDVSVVCCACRCCLH